jgi:hypothetical protein
LIVSLQQTWPKRTASISVILVGLLILVAQSFAVAQEPRLFEGLVKEAETITAAEILSTDYTATPADGPMVATAKILKVLKGPLTPGEQFRFAETAWVGPTYQKGEHRILFLEKAGPQEFPKVADWQILSHLHARTDFFIEKDSLSDLSLESLESFLKQIQESKGRPKKIIFRKGTVK